MQDFQRDFIRFAIDCEVLRFGSFTLKSGRISPYFFNAGLFNTGQRLATLGRFYAQAIEDANLDYDILFGPAYKGIPLVATTSIALADHHDKDIPYCFNRKEAKTHGEGGSLVGAELNGRALIIDDVITAGTAVREALAIIDQAGATTTGVVISLDRQERGQSERSAIQEVEQDIGIPVVRIINLADLINYLSEQSTMTTEQEAIKSYRDQYGV